MKLIMFIGAIIAIVGPALTAKFMSGDPEDTGRVRIDKGTHMRFRQLEPYLGTNGMIIAGALGILGLALILLPVFAPAIIGG